MTYWQKRQQQLSQQLEKDEDKLKKRMSSFYDSESRKLEKQISSFYRQYETDNIIEYWRLMEELPPEDKCLLIEQMDEFAVKYPEYSGLIPVRENIYKLNRLEGLQTSIKMQQLEIGAIEQDELNKHLTKNAARGVNAAAEQMGFGKNFYAMNPDIVKMFVNVPWADGKNFSQRIWDNTNKLANYLNTDIAAAFARGDSYDRIIRNMTSRFGKVARNDMYRLVYTEGTFVMAESTIKPFEDDFEEYRLSIAGSDACPVCKAVAQKTFKIKDRKAGINFPPLHAYCRCSHEIVVDDWDSWMDSYDGNNAENKGKKVVANEIKNAIMESDLGRFKEKLRNDENVSKEYYAVLKDKFSHGTDDAKTAFAKFVPKKSVENAFYEGTASYNTTTKKISMHYNADLNNSRGAGATWFHEHGHLIDDAVGDISDDGAFLELLKKDAYNYRIKYGKLNGLKTWNKVDSAISSNLNDMRKHSAVSDIFEGVTKGNIKGVAGHSDEYWNKQRNITSEAFAHMYEAQFDSIRNEEMKKYFPNALKYFEKKLKEMAR